ncbi:thiosulfate/3-mercaptopyruvate sulfurtransferase [Pseudomonas duriflava]|uniref:3-mercaptopyruvate sulfurtransferase n=1 Tax=Pseudomonas duriflava TaxID=459528 RepID=A0A562QNU0_9PSED|nr:3-mercaptopyruvate sulfurtransferase [Pseudomonas duriflava]TWI58333.1 thiosulfate/3-mercaptopyruvate sulfurtransferase [Pseudomonas duriflava]
MTFGPLVSTTWLADTLGAEDMVIFDASAYLPSEPQNAQVEYAAAHIPGARFFDIEALSDPDTALPHMAPSQGRFARMVSELGVSNNSRIVVYDQKGLFSAARVWWMFRLFGHDQVAVLDGGLPKWRAENRSLDSGQAAPVAPAHFNASLRTGLLRGLGDLKANLVSGAEHVLDARAAARFEGRVPEPRVGLAAGHIPGSANLPFNELLEADQTFKSPEALRERFIQAGVDGTRTVVTSCGSGLTAAVLLLGMAVACLPDGALYDGSWTEWGGREDTPKATNTI